MLRRLGAVLIVGLSALAVRVNGEAAPCASVLKAGKFSTTTTSTTTSKAPYYLVDAEPSQRLGLCEGDCDSNDHCKDGLKCDLREIGDPFPDEFCSGHVDEATQDAVESDAGLNFCIPDL